MCLDTDGMVSSFIADPALRAWRILLLAACVVGTNPATCLAEQPPAFLEQLDKLADPLAKVSEQAEAASISHGNRSGDL
jgi:hypothetical protein